MLIIKHLGSVSVVRPQIRWSCGVIIVRDDPHDRQEAEDY